MKNIAPSIIALTIGAIAGLTMTMPTTAQAEPLCRAAYEGTLCTEHSAEHDAAVYQWRSPDQMTQVSMVRNNERTLNLFMVETFNSSGAPQESTAFSLEDGGQIVFNRDYPAAWWLLHDNADIIFQLLLDNEYGIQNPM